MIQFFRPPLLILPLAALLAMLSREARAQAPQDQPAVDGSPLVTVELQSGRTFSGRISNRSTDERLVLLKERGTIKIWRPIAWNEIAAVKIDGEAAEVDRLRALANEAALRPGDERHVALRPAITSEDQPILPEEAAHIPVVTSITFDAFVANWDGDVETDGLVVLLAPLDADGGLAPVSGTVEIEFFAPQRRTFHHAPKSGGDTLERVERWTVQVHPADYGPRGAKLRLPFGAIHPELDQDWPANHYGLVHVRFAAAGHGVFEDSRDGVRIRPWAPNRDQLEMNTGRRFLPTEGLGRRD